MSNNIYILLYLIMSILFYVTHDYMTVTVTYDGYVMDM